MNDDYAGLLIFILIESKRVHWQNSVEVHVNPRRNVMNSMEKWGKVTLALQILIPSRKEVTFVLLFWALEKRRKVWCRLVVYLDYTFVRNILCALWYDARWCANKNVCVAGQFGKSWHVSFAVVTTSSFRTHDDTYVGARCDYSIGVLVNPKNLRRWITVNVTLQYLRRAVVGFNGNWWMTKLGAICFYLKERRRNKKVWVLS